jgi:uncharacterized protein YdhG (YjbR/CyaY superfamily)
MTASNKNEGFSDIEKAAMKERARELKAEARASKDKAAGEKDILEKLSDMPEPDRTMGMRIHELIKSNLPELSPRTWYGMPAYARDGKVVCFFQSGQKFQTRYCTFGFNEAAKLDEGGMWPTSYALTQLTSVEEKRLLELLKKAVG